MDDPFEDCRSLDSDTSRKLIGYKCISNIINTVRGRLEDDKDFITMLTYFAQGIR